MEEEYHMLSSHMNISMLQGMIFLTLSVTALKHKFLFFLALYVLAIGDGGHKPCVQTFAADQFDEDTPEERDTKSSFFNWWYLGIVAGSTASVFVVIYLQVNSWNSFVFFNWVEYIYFFMILYGKVNVIWSCFYQI